MNSKSTKKFLKKNILLQQNLEKFLDWREKKSTQTFSKSVLENMKIINPGEKKVAFAISKSKNKTLKKVYRPIQSKASLNKIQQNRRLLFSDFFPHKKPFMHLWIFPLLGGCFLSLLTLNKETNLIKKFPSIPNNETPLTLQKNADKNSSEWVLGSSVPSKTSSEDLFLSKHSKFLFTSPNSTESSYLTKEYYGYYSQTPVNRSTNFKTPVLSTELENLCSFYLNLTNQQLETLPKKVEFTKTQTNFFPTILAKNTEFQNHAQFNWVWHSLKMIPNNNWTNFHKPQLAHKLSSQNLNLPINSSYSFLLQSKPEFIQIPHVSYSQGKVVLDQWQKLLEYNSVISKNFEKNNTSIIFAKNSPFSFEKLNALEMLLSNSFKDQNKLFFHYFDLLEMFAKNQTKLKQTYLSQNTKIVTKNLIKPHLIFDEFNEKSNIPTEVLGKLQAHYRYSLLKILLENSVQTKNSKTFSKKQIQPILSEQKLKNVLKYTVFLNYIKQKPLLKNKISPILLKLQSLTVLKNIPNSNNLKSTQKELKNRTYELLLLKYWKEVFPNTDYFSPLQTKQTLETEKTVDKALDTLNITKPYLVSLQTKNTNVPQATQKFIKEINLYKRLNTLSKKLVTSTAVFKENNNEFANQKSANAKIITYTSPILMTNKLNLNFDSLKPQNPSTQVRKSMPWFEISAKQNNLENHLFFYKKPVLKVFNKDKLNSIQLTKNGFLTQNIKNLLPFKQIPASYYFEMGNFQFPISPQKTKTFYIMKPVYTVNNQTVFLLKATKNRTGLSLKTPVKSFKLKSPARYSFVNSITEKRKAEKIFRTYFSIKAMENNEENIFKKTNTFKLNSQKTKKVSSSLKSVFLILEKLKKNVQYKRRTLKHSYNYFYMNAPKNSYSISLEKHTNNYKISPFSSQKKAVFPSETNYNTKPSVSKTFLKKLGGNLLFLKKSDFTLNEMELKRLERKKALQKKRRLKKLKLENRRRKKRKRFYPRPNNLRFNLYYSFLQKRHSKKLNSTVSNKQNTNLVTIQKKSLGKKYPNKMKAQIFKEKIYRQKNQKWGNLSTKLMISEKSELKKLQLGWTVPTYHQQEFYKISNETLTEFERLCWKSYWLRSNLTPYIRRIQDNLKKMQKIENFKHSQKTFSIVLQNLLTWPVEKAPCHNSKPVFYGQKTQNVPAYLNIKETLDNSFLKNAHLASFKHLENKAEYNHLIYERITDQIKNVKSQLNVDGQTHARSYKSGRQKLEKPQSKSIWSSLNKWTYPFLEAYIQSFPLFSATHDASIKPFGDLPTLRVLWACHKTNLFTYHQNNFSRNVWSSYKNREQTKNNKTKKFVSKVFKLYNLSPKTVETMSLNKTKLATKKIQFFGGFVYGKNYNTYLHHLKFSLQKLNSSKLNLIKNSQAIDFKKSAIPEKNWFDANLGQKPQKRMVHFWWSTQQLNPIEQIFSLWVGSPLTYNDLNFYIRDNTNLTLEESVQKFTAAKSIFAIETHKNIILTTFWVSCLLFHVSILFTVIRIPEIRSLAKFQFLVLSKLANAYLLGLFSIYDLLLNYKTKIQLLVQKTQNISQLNMKKLNAFNKSGDFSENSANVLNSEKFLSNHYYLNNQKNGQFFLQNQSFESSQKRKKPTSRSLIHTTMNFELSFRQFFNIPFLVEKLPKVSGKSGNELPQNQKSLKATLLYSINPLANKIKLPSNLLKTSHLVISSNWFYSWYTGFLWYTFSKALKNQNSRQNVSNFSKQKETYLNSYLTDSTFSRENVKNPKKKNLKTSKQSYSGVIQSNIQIQSILSLLTLYASKLVINIFFICFNLFYQCLFKLIDIMEGILMIFYKFLEKPAELMVDWIAEIFLIEWSSDVTTYIPEAFDTSVWNSMTKFSRSTRPFGGFVFGFITQKMFLGSLEIFYTWVLKPDTDLMIRQKKGVIFWDIWAEILIQAAEKYKMNLSSLSTLKEEQELLIENLLEDKNFTDNKGEVSKLQSSKSLVKQTNFLNSETFKLSLQKMTPLMKFLQTSPTNPSLTVDYASFRHFSKSKNNPYQFLNSNLELSNLNFLKIESHLDSPFSQNGTSIDSWKRWSVNQALTTQGRDTDLFMDIHPPKSFLNISFLKTYLPAQEILGSLVCEIYSGLFPQKVSKNILVVGAPGSAKSFFIQALAGETELKVVTDNAHRYALVQGGVPIGMKLLRDVFDSIALHTPCLFLLEDIHIIGERRPMLISDDENSKSSDSVFGAEQEEVHEKNRLIYQLSRHSISHYKKPYKGDFSLSIPTNHFCYDLFLGISPSRKRRSGLTAKSPLPLVQLEKTLTTTESSTANTEESSYFSENKPGSNSQMLLSSLQLSAEQVFAPPATSPFTILLMKEQKKLKPRKFVKEMPWSGLSYDQYMLISKSHYSVRVKVALLAELAMRNLSVKLDMITDLLVIIDSVRSNRGFVVFATTHVPSLLDPALRRPGRLDETISLPLLPNLMSRFEIFKTNLSSYVETTDLFDYSLFTSATKQNENQIYASISKSLLLLLNAKNSKKFHLQNNLAKPILFPTFFNDYPIYSISQAFQTSMNLNSSLMNTSQLQKCLNKAFHKKFENQSFTLLKKESSNLANKDLSYILQSNPLNVVFSGNDKLNYISLTYAQAGQFLVEALILKDQTTYACKFLTSSLRNPEAYNTEDQIFKTLYSSRVEYKNILLKLFAGQIAEFFVLNPAYSQKAIQLKTNLGFFVEKLNKPSVSNDKNWWLTQSSLLQTNPSQSVLFDNIQNYQTYWQSATSFLESLYQKRFLYTKNSVVSKMLFFQDNSSLREPPSPPNSSILMPAKKFENYKRTLKDFIQKPILTINEKLQLHQKQRFLKLLYNIPVQTTFKTVSNQNNFSNSSLQLQKTTFYNSFKELGYLDLLTLKPSSTYAFFQNRFLTRHRFSFLNQWWNGQLAEHNVETTYLSHVDWRSMFVQSLGDLVIDFPDAEQYYNPRLRRWFLQTTSWNYWLSFDKNLKQEISQHYILYCFTKTSNLLNSNRELFDYLAYRFLRDHQLKEIDLLDSLIRYHKTNEVY